MEFTRDKIKVKWQELLPDEFIDRQEKCPIVYLPMGLCEPHGHIAAFGLDTIKAEYICDETARKMGGVVAPTQNYHIHETGYHAPWLEEVIGKANPYMASLPPEILLHLFLYQLRAFANAGFKGVVVITGHSGGNQEDLRKVAYFFMDNFPLKIEVRADPELVKSKFVGDHAGKFEISQLMYIRPDLIDMSKIFRQHQDKLLGRFALGLDAQEASPELGREIMEACVNEACRITEKLIKNIIRDDIKHINFQQIEMIWKKIYCQRKSWSTYNLHEGQKPSGNNSVWKIYEAPENLQI